MIGTISAGAMAARAARGALGGLAKRWYLLPIVALAVALVVTRGTLADARQTMKTERAAYAAAVANAASDKAAVEARYATRVADAATTYAAQLAAREPIIIRSTDTVRTYAQTPAGRAACLAPERVRGVDALDVELFAGGTASASGGAPALPADADRAPAGR